LGSAVGATIIASAGIASVAGRAAGALAKPTIERAH
jgi:hypothetical protein